MSKYNNIAVIYGSDTSEWEVSCKSGKFTASCMDNARYAVYEVFARFGRWHLAAYRNKNSERVELPENERPSIDKSDFSVVLGGRKVKFDFAYVMQHGAPGENGLIQGYFQMVGVPFSSCDAFVSAVAFDKFACKNYLCGIRNAKLAPDAFIRKGEDIGDFEEKVNATLRYPVFVKPTNGGSSFGVTKVKNPEDLKEAIEFAYKEGDTVLVEQGVSGRELTCAVYFDGKEVRTLPQIEIVSENEYFDYDAKYNGRSQEICPAPVSAVEEETIARATREIYSRLGCRGLVRVDYILSLEGLYFLEVNTIPGMTSASLVPKMLSTAGMSVTDFLTSIIENA